MSSSSATSPRWTCVTAASWVQRRCCAGAARARRHTAVAVHPDRRGEQPHQCHRRVVLERCCMDFRALRRHIPIRPDLAESVAQAAQAASFILNCRSIFERHQVPARSFELEITETTLMADPRRTCRCSISCTTSGCTCRSMTSVPGTHRSRPCSSSRSAR